MKTRAPEHSAEELNKYFRDAAEAAVACEPKLPAAGIAELVLNGADADVAEEMGQILLLRHFATMAREIRAEQLRREREQYLLPGFDHLPARIAIGKNRRVFIRQANLTQLRNYLRALNRSHRNRRENDLRRKEMTELLEGMTKASRKHKGITAAQALGL